MKKNLSYMDSVHRDGRIWNLSVMVLLMLFPVLVCLIFGVIPDWNALLVGLVGTLPMYWAVGIIETVTYVPMLGAGGSYLSCPAPSMPWSKTRSAPAARRAKWYPPLPSPFPAS